MIYICIVLLFSLSAAFFSGIETALITANPFKIYGKLKDDKGINIIVGLFNNMNMVINTLLVGTNISVVSAAIIFSLYFQDLGYSPSKAMVVSTSTLTLFMLIFSEIIPKAFCLRHSSRIILRFYPVLRFFMFVLYPITIVLKLINRLILKERKNEEFISREKVEFLFYKEDEAEEVPDEREFIYQVFNLSDVRVKEIMIPLNEVAAVPIHASRQEVLDRVREHYFSRLPVYQDEIYDFVGYVNIKQLLYNPDLSLKDSLQETLFFPEVKAADEALFEMQKAQKPMAFLVDEYGAVSGIISKEDLAELIVGNIEDELHQEETIIKIRNGYIIPGFESVDRLNDDLGLKIKKNDFETLSGFIAAYLGKIPEVGDSFSNEGFDYLVLKTEKRVAVKVRVTQSEKKKILLHKPKHL